MPQADLSRLRQRVNKMGIKSKDLKTADKLVHSTCTEKVRRDYYNRVRELLEEHMMNDKLYCRESKKSKKMIPLNDDTVKKLFFGKDPTTEYLKVMYIKDQKKYIRLFELSKELLGEVILSDLVPIAVEHGFNDENMPAVYDAVKRYAEGALSDANYVFALDERNALRILESNPNCRILGSVAGREAVLKEIPEDITTLFPMARALRRHFILHVGDTNSGKTYESIEELKKASTGAYLAPLRLLALETQDKLINSGVPCSLLTGEEEDIVENATHISSTVEMLDLGKEYEVVVIDEAQMIADEDRGYAWTKAILGVVCKRVHVCMSENAREIVEKLIKSCGDTFEVVKHVRNTPLVFQTEDFIFPRDIKPHDALIVFSRKDVLSVAADLSELGITASVVYGALPYSVRKNEVERFMRGDTSVVVATDAIGMGMNLPVERIVFLESTKFDGKQRRMLKGPEIKQIAGRAGRLGMYDVGYVNALSDKDELMGLFYEEYRPIEKARIQMPEKLLSLDMKLTEIITNWMRVADEQLYEKSDSELILKKCRYMEDDLKGLTKEEMWRFALVPYDEKNETLEFIWKKLVRRYLDEVDIEVEIEYDLSDIQELSYLEQDYKILDLYYAFARTIGYNKDDFRRRIFERKEIIAADIMKALLEAGGQKRVCKKCGRPLSWNTRYGICENCHKYEELNYKRKKNFAPSGSSYGSGDKAKHGKNGKRKKRYYR